MRTLEGSNRVRNGLLGIVVLLIALGVGQSFASVPMLFATPTYYAQFSDTGGVNTGDKVRIAGVDVGRVRSMKIDGDKVVIGYSLGGTQIGTDSRASIRTDTILGRRNIEIEPRGTKPLRANGILPLGQTTTPYQIYDAFFDVTKAASGWDTQTVKRSLKDPRDPFSAPYTENWMSYVWSTGANWNGPIHNFHLTIDKGDPKALVSFCWDGKVTKTGPTTFSMQATDFSPPQDHELEILLLNPAGNADGLCRQRRHG